MAELKKCDVFIGVKAEQSLRDAVRTAAEESENPLVELTPVGRKDWVAGVRTGFVLASRDMEAACRDVHKKLIALNSLQRIRFENIRLHVVQLPVPVFRDVSGGMDSGVPDRDRDDDDFAELDTSVEEQADEDLRDQSRTASPDAEKKPRSPRKGPTTCPVCKRQVHNYNLHYNTNGKIVGCFMCGGHPIDY